MKKLIGIILLAVVFTGCETIEVEFTSAPDMETSVVDCSYKVSSREANKFVEVYKPGQAYFLDPIVDGTDTLLYVYNFDEGWLVVSGDRRLNPIIGESREGNINVNAIPEGILSWIEERVYHVKKLRGDLTPIENEHTFLWDNLFSKDINTEDIKTKAQTMKWCVVSYLHSVIKEEEDVIPHLIETKWGQGSTWNNKFPIDANYPGSNKCLTGCVAVAVSQLLYYTHYNLGKPNALYHQISCDDIVYGPTTDIGFSRGDLHQNSTRWDDMALKIGIATPQINIDYVGDLMMDVGNRFGMKYSASESGTNITASAFSYYDLSYSKSAYSYDIVKDNLEKGLPVLVSAYTEIPSSSRNVGHAWIIDGIRRVETIYRWQKHVEYSENWMYESEVYNSFEEIKNKYNIEDEFDIWFDDVITNTDYLLMNWGEDGAYDEGLYSTSADASWEGDDDQPYPYTQNREIYYDFR